MKFYIITLKFFKVKTIKKNFSFKGKVYNYHNQNFFFSSVYLIFKDRKVNVLKKFSISFTKFNSAPPTQPLPTFKFQYPLLSFRPKEKIEKPKVHLILDEKNLKLQTLNMQWRNLGFKDSNKDFSPPQ